MLEPWTNLARDVAPDPFAQSREVASRIARAELARVEQLPLPQSDVDWILEHAPWLWNKPRVKVYVSMETGECRLGVFDALLFHPASPMSMDMRQL